MREREREGGGGGVAFNAQPTGTVISRRGKSPVKPTTKLIKSRNGYHHTNISIAMYVTYTPKYRTKALIFAQQRSYWRHTLASLLPSAFQLSSPVVTLHESNANTRVTHYVLQSGFSTTLSTTLCTPVFRRNPPLPVHVCPSSQTSCL